MFERDLTIPQREKHDGEKPDHEETESKKDKLHEEENVDRGVTRPIDEQRGRKNTRTPVPQKRLTLKAYEEQKNKKRRSAAPYQSLTEVLRQSEPSRNWEDVFGQFKKAQDNENGDTEERVTKEGFGTSDEKVGKRGKKRTRRWKEGSSSSTDAPGGNWGSCWIGDWSWGGKSGVDGKGNGEEANDSDDWDYWSGQDWRYGSDWEIVALTGRKTIRKARRPRRNKKRSART